MSQRVDTNGVPLPSIGKRLAAMAYETLLILGVLSVTFMIPHLALGIGMEIVLPGYVLLAHVFVVLAAYFLWYWTHGGQTLAMQTWKLQISTPSGAMPSPTLLTIRYCLAWPCIAIYGVGLVWALIDRDRQFLHDRLAGTRIVCKG
jgi:uncharacterized RDD family membrane protein YckC